MNSLPAAQSGWDRPDYLKILFIFTIDVHKIIYKYQEFSLPSPVLNGILYRDK
jgi:hypothetical protein